MRDGKKIKGATLAKYRLTTKDVGKRVSVRVSAQRTGFATGTATSSAVKVGKGKPSVKVTAAAVKVGKAPKVVVRVKAAGLTKPTGTVTVKYGSKSVKVQLSGKNKGKVVVTLPRLAKGTHKVKASFSPTKTTKKYVTKASSTTVKLRVR